MYGSATEAPYVNNGGSFYLKIPAAAVDAGALVNVGQPSMNFAYLALHGFGRSADVTYSDTPAIMAWQGPAASSPTGEQDWGHVQAFIGFVNNIEASLYGEGHLLIKGHSDDASIRVSKDVLEVTGEPANAGSFVFTLEVYDNSLGQWVPVPLIPDTPANAGVFNITGASGLTSVSPGGVFSLADGDVATIIGLPLGQYRVSEQEKAEGYTTVYQLGSNAAASGAVAEVLLNLQTPSRAVGFTNTLVPLTPETPENPETPETPGTPDTPGDTTKFPPTGDRGARTATLAAILILGGAGIVARSRRKASQS
jgi:LPXTG-motif cell wall-anchored protein